MRALFFEGDESGPIESRDPSYRNRQLSFPHDSYHYRTEPALKTKRKRNGGRESGHGPEFRTMRGPKEREMARVCVERRDKKTLAPDVSWAFAFFLLDTRINDVAFMRTVGSTIVRSRTLERDSVLDIRYLTET